MTAELTDTGADYAIVVRDANKRYGDFVALDHVDFVVPTGSLTALLGPSGSGKSTLLRTIAGLDHPDSGAVTINGRDVTRVPPQRRGIGFVFQHYAAFKHMTVRDNVAYGPKIRKQPKAEIKAKGRQPAGGRGTERVPKPLSQPALRRSATAHGAGARVGGRPRSAAARRAVRGAGRQGPRRSAGMAAAPARRGACHHGAGHPRSGRGTGRGRPDRGAQQGTHRAGRIPDRGLRRPGQRVRDVVPGCGFDIEWDIGPTARHPGRSQP